MFGISCQERHQCSGSSPKTLCLEPAADWRWLPWQGKKNNKKTPVWKQCRLDFCAPDSLLSSLTCPPTASQRDLCMRSRDPWKLQKAARRNIWMILMGEWRRGREGGRDDGGFGWELGSVLRKARQMWRICSAAAMTGRCVPRWQSSLDSQPSHPGTTTPGAPWETDVPCQRGWKSCSNCNRGGVYFIFLHQVRYQSSVYPTNLLLPLSSSLYLSSAGWILIFPWKLQQYVFLGNSTSPERCKMIWCLWRGWIRG